MKKTLKTKIKTLLAAAIVLGLALPPLAMSNNNFVSGQLFQLVGEQIGLIQDEDSALVAVGEGEEEEAQAIQLPLIADESTVPVSFQAANTRISTEIPAWGDGEPVVEGTSVILEE